MLADVAQSLRTADRVGLRCRDLLTVPVPVALAAVLRPLPDQPSRSQLSHEPFVDMLKNLCERGPATIRWESNTPKLEGRPTSFKCTSPVLILLNTLPAKNPDLLAVLDRCHNFEFRPTKVQVIADMPTGSSLVSCFGAVLVLFAVARTLLPNRSSRV